MNRRSLLISGLILSAALVLTWLNAPPVSSQGITLAAVRVPGELPTADPDSDLWQKATALEVPLSAQAVARPMSLNARVKSVTVRALHNDTRIAFLIEWADETKNDSAVRVQDFRDAVAMQFPLIESQPFFCMGQPGGNVNIWHWKADWQADIAARQDMETLYPDMYVDEFPFADPAAGLQAGPATYLDPDYLPALASENLFASATFASPVEDLIAGGFDSLTAQPAAGQNVAGHGVWADGRWRVIFSRDLTSADSADVSFAPGKIHSVAFAAWDGANNERNGQKSTSQWVALQLESTAPPARPATGSVSPTLDNFAVLAVVFGPLVIMGGCVFALAGLAFVLSKLTPKQ